MKLKVPALPAVRSLACGAVLAALSGAALADYRYTYTGHIFSMATEYVNSEANMPVPEIQYSDQVIQAVIVSATPLATGTTIGELKSFSMTLTPAFGIPVTLDYRFSPPWDPEHPPYPLPGPGSPGNPLIDTSFAIGAMDANGLPSSWELFISHAVLPFHRWEYWGFGSTQALDRVDSYLEGVYSSSGALAGSPGVWQLAVVVPEPSRVALMLAGLGLLGWALQRQRRT